MNLPSNQPGRGGRRNESRIFGIPVWWLMSGIFHVLLLGWLVFFSPVRAINLEKKRAEFTAGSDKIREVMDQVRERQADLLASSVRELAEMRQELAELERGKLGEFAKFSAEFSQDAPGLAEQAQEAAVKAQAEALAGGTAAGAEAGHARTNRVNDDFKPLAAAQKKVESAQDRVAQAQDRAAQVLAMSGPDFESARKAQVDANAAQEKAAKAQLDVNNLLEPAMGTHSHATHREREVERAQETLRKYESDLANARSNVVAATTNLAATRAEALTTTNAATEARAAAETARVAATEAKAAHDKLGSKDPGKKDARAVYVEMQDKANAAKRAADQARSAADKAQRMADSAQRKLDSTQKDLQRAEQRLAESKTRLEKAQAESADARQKAAELDTKVATLQTSAQQLQTEAQAVQKLAREALAVARRNAATNQLAALTNKLDNLTNTWATNFLAAREMDLAEVYQAAVETEAALTESYKRLRATELAMVRQIPLQRAMQLTEVAKVVRPNLQPVLRAAVSSGEEVPAAREAIQAAGSEVNAMVTLGASLLMQARSLDRSGSRGEEGATISLEDLKAMTAQMQAMEGLAAEDESERAKDLSAAMQTGNGSGKSGAGGRAPRPGAGLPGAGVPGLPGRAGVGFAPPVFPRKLDAFPGRKVAATGTSPRWLYVDSWYILGPFDNTGRANIDKKYPPETVVDLNATYEGKNGKPIRWEFHQAPDARVMAPFDHFNPVSLKQSDNWGYFMQRQLDYIIYYAYTELWFDEPCDLWVAVGSDDFSKVWLNEQLIWSSGKTHKAWNVSEGIRKVHFSQGRNRILYRIENGQGTTAFSLVVCLQ